MDAPAPAAARAQAAQAASSASPAKPATATTKMFGTGSYTSGPIHFGCVTDGNPVKIKYRYSGNISDGIPGNFEAELDDSTGVEVGNDNIVNDIAASGSKTTNLYLDPDVDTPPFHLHVDAEPGGHWSLTFTCDKGQ